MDGERLREHWATLLIPVALILGLAVLLGLQESGNAAESVLVSPLETWLKWLVGYLATGAEIAAAFVIGMAILQGFLNYLRYLVAFSSRSSVGGEAIRLQLGRFLALGLEFTVASDILRTAVAPTRQDILTLAAIVLLRSLLNYFLEREIRDVEGRRVPSSPAPAGPREGESHE
jgi:uncharacterized membrane protein